MIRYYSFDIFDTCLVRLCGDPRNVFEVLSIRIQNDCGDRWNDSIREAFVTARTKCYILNCLRLSRYLFP